MKSISISEAKIGFLTLIERVIRGEKIVITKYGKPTANLIPYRK